MKNLKNILEGLLKGMNDTLDAGQDALSTALNLDTVPKVKDFKRNPYNKDRQFAAWYCPNVLSRYSRMYPDMIDKSFTSIHVVIDKYMDRVIHVDLWFADSVDAICGKKAVQGWTDGFTAPLAKCKSIAIDMIKFLANNPDKMDKVMAYAYECFKFYKNNETDTNGRKYKLQKSIIDLKYERL